MFWALALSACGTNDSGNLRSPKTGDTSHPAERRSPVAFRASCGEGQRTTYGLTNLKRHPYLQQVTTDATKVGWVTTEPNGARIDITDPVGTPLVTAPAEREQVSLRTAGENQVWADLADLSPATTYCYALGDDMNVVTDRTGFRTAPSATSTEPVRILAFGDSGGGGSDQKALLREMYTVPFDLMIHTGDVAYDDGTIGEFEANVFGIYADLFRSIPFYPAAGNHDYNTMQGAPFREVFNLPAENGEKWYSYRWGRVYFAALDTESDYATQAAWLDQDLAANTLPWKIVYLHRPPYSSGWHGSDDELREALAPVLEKHGVQLVLAGHDHNYERMHPQNGVAYVVTGGGGRGTRGVGTSDFTAFSVDVIHFVYIEVALDELTLHAIDATGQEFDSMVVPR